MPFISRRFNNGSHKLASSYVEQSHAAKFGFRLISIFTFLWSFCGRVHVDADQSSGVGDA